MNTQGQTLEIALEQSPIETLGVPDLGPLARLGQAIMRTLREAAWRFLDLETEFDVLD